MDGTRESPWVLKTPSGQSEYQAFRDEALDPPALVVQVGRTELLYRLRCIDDLHEMLKSHGDWMPLGSADEQKPAAEGTVEAWARSPSNPVEGWYGLKNGLRGRFANYVPPVLEKLGLAELEHGPRNKRDAGAVGRRPALRALGSHGLTHPAEGSAAVAPLPRRIFATNI